MKIVFIVNGLGLGNSTRCHAVIQQLVDKGSEIHVVTSGNGLWYFAEREEIASITELDALYYSKKEGKISVLETLGSLLEFKRIIERNNIIIFNLIKNIKPDIVVTDSEYSFRSIKKAKLPYVALNNSDFVVAHYMSERSRPRQTWAQFGLVEYSDFTFHRLIPDIALSPALDPNIPPNSPKFQRIGPIVRKGYRTDRIGNGEATNAAIMLSGSTFGTHLHLTRSQYPVKIDVIGRNQPKGGKIASNVEFHGKIKDTYPFLSRCDIVVVNGGFSAISEAFCMRKPVIVVPVPGHAEQWVNGRVIEKLGVGMIADETNIEEKLFVGLENIDHLRASYDQIGAIPDGAAQAANLLFKIARESS